jgi:hypothetical protein
VTFPTKVTAPTGYRVFGYQTTGKQIAPTFTLNVVRVA